MLWYSRTGWKTASSAIPADPADSQIHGQLLPLLLNGIPEPNTRAKPDSFLKSPEAPAGDMLKYRAIDDYSCVTERRERSMTAPEGRGRVLERTVSTLWCGEDCKNSELFLSG